MIKKRVLMDLTMTARWCRAGVMVGIVRVACEMYKSLQKMTEVHMVQLEKKEGKEEPDILVINPETFEVTEEVILPDRNDLFLMPEIQIRGIHVPMDYPWPGYLEKYGIDRCALIHDILPIEMGEYFEKETAQRMPEYLLGIFNNYNQIICVSNAVLESVRNFWEKGEIDPFCLNTRSLSRDFFYAVLRDGWQEEGGFIKARPEAGIVFFTNVMTTLMLRCTVVRATGEYRVIANGYDVGTIAAGGVRTEAIRLPAEVLDPGGFQEIRLVSLAADAECVMEKFSLCSAEIGKIPVRGQTVQPVRMAWVHEGVQKKKAVETHEPTQIIENFFQRKADENSFLMVGTIEPRKGHEIVLNTFERLWGKGQDDKLCIIGRPGWNMDSFAERLRSHPEAGKRLLLIENASDELLLDAYQKADALIQASAGEGFGLPLIEAGDYGKPVLCSDIPVFHEIGGENVLYFRRDPEGLADCIRYFKEHRGTDQIPDSRKISRRTWDDFSVDCYQLMSGDGDWPVCLKPGSARRKKEKKVVVATTYAVYPPLNGGQARVFGLYKNLAEKYKVEIICMAAHTAEKKRRLIAHNLIENVVPMSEANERKGWEFEKKAGVPASDTSVLLYTEDTSDYALAIQRIGQDADWMIACHPYPFPLIRKLLPEKKVIYEAQDVEYEIKREMYQSCEETEEALKKLFYTERECCEYSEMIIPCSEKYKEELGKLYGTKPSKIVVVPNGVDTGEIAYVSVPDRIRNKRRNGLESEKIGVFMGAYHEPNLEAARALISIAPQIRNAKIFLLGSQCVYFRDKQFPANMAPLGVVTDEEKERILSLVDFALNPMSSGSGTNVKMFDYMAAGVPVITSSFGSRGIDRKDVFITSEIDELPRIINEFQLPQTEKMVENARAYIEEKFDWRRIAEILIQRMKELEAAETAGGQ